MKFSYRFFWFTVIIIAIGVIMLSDFLLANTSNELAPQSDLHYITIN